MSDLLITALTPTLGSGTGLRTYGVTAALSRHHAVNVAYVVWGASRPAGEYARLGSVTLRPLRGSRGPSRALAYARARAGMVPHDLARGVSPAMAAAARAAPTDARLIADGPVAAAALLPIARRRAVVYLAHNLESGGFRGENERAGLERFERIVLRTFSEAWMATRADEWGARALAGERIATRYVPNVVDTDRIEPVTPAGTGCMLFVADFTYPPNVEAFRFLTERVMPAVWERQPALRLLAVGRGLSGRSPDPRIITPGFVDDLTRAYRDADVALVPLLRGGGSPLKFIEALAYGLPVVASAHAAALLEDGAPGRDFLVADGVEEFAAAIDGLLADPARRAQLGAAGRELAVRSHSIAALATLLAS